MKTFLLFLFVLCTISSNANDYYFSSTSGDDSRSAIQARNSSTPWKSLGKLNAIFSTLLPGDNILLKRGETFNGSIIINKSGTASKPIVISAYGSGNKPLITGLATVTDWVSVGGGIYESYNSSLSSNLSMVLINNVEQAMGRYPNSNTANKGYLTLESHSNTSITDKELSSSPNWKGAEVVIRSSHWTIDRNIITSHSGTTLSYKAAGYYTPRDNFGYFIQNSIKTLDQFGEWYYNPSTKKLSVFFGSNNPSSYAVKGAAFKNLVYSSSKSYVMLDNLEFKGANEDGIYIKGGSNMTIQNCDLSFSGIDGINVSSSRFQLLNSTVLYSNNDGVDAGRAGRCIIKNNVVKDSYFIAGMGGSGNGMGRGIVNCQDGLVQFNTVLNSGYIGIYLGGDRAIVKNNYVDNFCFVKDDAGGIYFANERNAMNTGRQVTDNIITNSPGAAEGTDGSSQGQGIYMDDNTNGVLINGNTVSNCALGMYLHNTRQLIIKNNTFFNNFTTQLYMKHDALGEPLRNHTITNNVFFAKSTIQLASSINTKDDDIGSTGRFDSNYYARPIDDKMVFFNTTHLYSSSEIRNYRDLDGWKSTYSKDPASKRSSKQIKPYTIGSLVGANKVANGDFATANVKPIWGNSCSLSWQNSGVLDGGYLKVAPSAASSNIVFGIAALSSSKKYLLRFSLKGTSNMSLTTYLRSADYSPITPNQLLKVTASRSENEIIFSPSANQTNGSLVFKVDAKSTYYLDNIQLYEVNASTTNPDDSIRFVVNSTQASKTFTLAGNYVDVKNTKYSNSIVLQPYSSAVLIKNGGTGTISNLAPTVDITSPSDNATFISSAAITINASADDADGSVSKVDFYNGNAFLGSDNTSPYSYTWNNVATGTYTITAKATDNSAAVTTSSEVMVSVGNSDTEPTVSITSPSDNANFSAPASITINASADDVNGSIAKVSFYNGSTYLGYDDSSPYSFTWNNVAAGNYTLTSKATDNSGNVTTSAAVSITVTKSNGKPAVNITSPSANATFNAPASITINASADDADGSITKVSFYNGSTYLGYDDSSPYSFTWNNVAAGNYTLTSKATDNSGNVTTSAAVSITVTKSNGKPAVNITSPSNNATFNAPASITINASADDADGSITKVSFYNGSSYLGYDDSSPYSFTWNNVAAGNYTLTSKATDNSGNVTTSAAVTVSVLKSNAYPTVSITSPSNDATFNAPASITINTSADDADGSIAKVSFYNGSTYLGYDDSSPYSFTWNNVAAGNYTLTSKATDNSGNVSTSSAVAVSVAKSNGEPTVNITSPSTDATFNAPASITINTSANDANGSITKVSFYNGSTYLGYDNSSPYSLTWKNVAAGNYTITSKATDNSGNVTTSSPVEVSVQKDGSPAVHITSPLNGATFKDPASITINTSAADADGSITKVSFYNGNTYLGYDDSSPYSFTWNNVAAGDYTITSMATDNSGNVTTSAQVIVSVLKKGSPAVNITSPSNGATFNAPASITIKSSAADADGSIVKVSFYNGSTYLGYSNASPYSLTWKNVEAGNYTITSKATDNSGNVTTSSPVMIAVIEPNAAPTVSITSPSINATFTSADSVTINVNAADADGSVSKVDFYNDNTLIGSDSTSPYSFIWKNIAAGNYTITAKATDNGFAVTNSNAVSISVTASNAAPTVSITSPTNNATITSPDLITINANAADADGSISKVDFYDGSTLLGSDSTSPYAFTWNNVAAGSYTLIAKATDNNNAVTISDAVSINVAAPNAAPTVTITSPTNNTSYNEQDTVTITATAADSNGSISKVDFYNGSTLLGSDSTSPYSFTWNNVATGNYTITAKATDNNNAFTTSDTVAIFVETQNAAPSLSITSPTDNASVTNTASVTINVSAVDEQNAISKVDYYNGSTLIGSGSTKPYSYTWNDVAEGSYKITAKAINKHGAVTASDAITFSAITSNTAPKVRITTPKVDKKYEDDAKIFINAAASDADGTVSKVDFYNGKKLLHTEYVTPYSYLWQNVSTGDYTITAVATDNDGNVTTSKSVKVTVRANTAPSVHITSPQVNQKFTASATISISATASDNDGAITKVEFYNGKKLLHTEYKLPYSYSWTNVSAGNYKIIAKAFDNSGHSTTSSSVAVTVTGASNTALKSTADTTSMVSNTSVATNSSNDLNNGFADVTGLSKKISPATSGNVIIKVGPNPATDVVFVYTDGLPSDKDLRITLLSINGVALKTIETITSNKAVQINISTLKNGVYIMQVTSGDTKILKQFIKD